VPISAKRDIIFSAEKDEKRVKILQKILIYTYIGWGGVIVIHQNILITANDHFSLIVN
jgi:hypothetical protein